MHGFSLCLYSPKGLRVRHFALREQVERRIYSSRFAKAALAAGYTHWDYRRE